MKQYLSNTMNYSATIISKLVRNSNSLHKSIKKHSHLHIIYSKHISLAYSFLFYYICQYTPIYVINSNRFVYIYIAANISEIPFIIHTHTFNYLGLFICHLSCVTISIISFNIHILVMSLPQLLLFWFVECCVFIGFAICSALQIYN